MDLVDVIAIVLGVAGAALGGLGWWKASEAKVIAAGAYRAAQEAKQAAIEAQRSAVEAKAATQAGNLAARAPLEPLPKSTVLANLAKIVVRSGSNSGEDLPTNQGTGSGLIGIFLINEGPAAAHDMQLHATFPNGTRRSSEPHRTLSAHKEVTLFAQVVPADFGADDPLHVLYQIAYQDGNGDQAFEHNIRLEGGWKGPWKTYIEAKI